MHLSARAPPGQSAGSVLRACIRLTLWRQTGAFARLAVLGRHISQCLWGAINAPRGHGLIAHHAALVRHLVCATQHFALLVWGSRACGDSHNQDHCASPNHCSVHSPISESREHVLTLSTIGDANPNRPTKLHVRVPSKPLRFRGPRNNDPDQEATHARKRVGGPVLPCEYVRG
jgi:hypothetical protein